MKHYRVTGLTTDNRGCLIGELLYAHQERVIKPHSEECWGCGERRLLSQLEKFTYRDLGVEQEAFYCLDNEDCQRKSGALKRWIR